MSCTILKLTDGRAVLANSIAEWAFGPLFPSPEEAAEFIRWLNRDPQDVILECLLAGRQPDIALASLYETWRTSTAMSTTTPALA